MRLTPHEEGIGDQDAGQGVGGVGELVGEADVAGGVDVGVGGLQGVADRHAAPVILDAGRFQPQPLDIGRAAHADQDGVDNHFDLLTFTLQAENPVIAPPFDGNNLHTELQFDPFAQEGGLQNPGGILILASQDLRCKFYQCHPAAEAGKGLGQFAADGAATDHAPGAGAARSGRRRSRWSDNRSPPGRVWVARQPVLRYRPLLF